MADQMRGASFRLFVDQRRAAGTRGFDFDEPSTTPGSGLVLAVRGSWSGERFLNPD